MDYKKFIKIFPFIMGLLLIPIFMRTIFVSIPYEVQLHWKGETVDADTFSYGRSILLIITSVIISGIIFFTFTKKTIIKIKALFPFVISISILSLGAIISTILGGKSVISLGGAPSRYEGLYSYISYFLLFFYSMIIDYDKKSEQFILIIISIFTILCSIVGFSQFIGKDIFLTDIGKIFYLPKEYRYLNFRTNNPTFKTMYLFTTHYNYSSMLMSMISMFWSTYFICTNIKKNKILAGIMSLISMVMLFAINARSGIIAIIIAILILIITFTSKIISNKKISILIFLIFLSFIYVMFHFGFMSRANSIIEDIKKINFEKIKTDDYIREKILLKDIEITDNTYILIYDNATIKFDNKTNNFYDKNNKILKLYSLGNGKIQFEDEGYNMFTIEISKMKSNIDNKEHLYHLIKINNNEHNIYNFDITDKIMLVNHLGLPMYPEKAEMIGFKGLEKLGSGRMFILSSTLPLIKKSPIVGYGPDSFLMVFNQDDIYRKLYVYEQPMHLVDKPHNLYLLLTINFGLIGLITFLYIIVLLIFKAHSKYKKTTLFNDSLYIGAFAGAMGYIGSGFFNDSNVAVSPIFWTLLGISISGISIKN